MLNGLHNLLVDRFAILVIRQTSQSNELGNVKEKEIV
jgi:hypothetical protein